MCACLPRWGGTERAVLQAQLPQKLRRSRTWGHGELKALQGVRNLHCEGVCSGGCLRESKREIRRERQEYRGMSLGTRRTEK